MNQYNIHVFHIKFDTLTIAIDCGIIRIHDGSIFVDSVGTPHPRIYIFNIIISKIFIEHFDEKRNYMQHSL